MEIEQLKNEIAELNRKIDLLYNSTDIPNNVEQAFRTRFQLDTYNPIIVSAKSASSENQAVNEGGVAAYNVMKPPDAFIQITLNGAIKYIPIYT